MDLPDFDEPFDPDFDPDVLDKKLWAEVPEPIRKDVEQYVEAHLPTDILETLRDLHAHGLPISDDDAFFHFGGGWSSGTFAESGWMTTNWQPAGAWAPIGTTAISAYSPRSLRNGSKGCRFRGRRSRRRSRTKSR
jgi:hypothetical protein